MKICFPTSGNGGMNDEVGFHFGRVPSYTIYDDERDEVDVIPNESSHRGGSGLPADLLAEQGVDAMVCGDLGRKALTLFDDHCIEVYTGYSGKKVSEALKEWQEGNSSPASEGDGCQEHAFRDESHHHKGDRRHG